MDESHSLIKGRPESNLLKVGTSDLLARGLGHLRSSTNQKAIDLFESAMVLCDGVDFIKLAPLNPPQERVFTDCQLDGETKLEEAARLGHREAKFCLGVMRASRRPIEAIKLYKQASDQGHAEGAYQYVKYLYFDSPDLRLSFAPQISPSEVIQLLEVAAQERHFQASCALGAELMRLADGSEGTERTSLFARAFIWLSQAAELGDAESAYRLGELYCLGDGSPQDYVLAAKWYGFAAEKGHYLATSELATLYERGKGVSRDKFKAGELFLVAGNMALENGTFQETKTFYEYATELGNGEAALRAAELVYKLENNTVTNEVVQWWLRGGTAGYLPAILRLCKHYKGRDISEWLGWMKLAAAQDPSACYALGKYYRDKAEHLIAKKWFREGAEKGDKDCQFELALLLIGSTNPVAAEYWFKQAFQNGHDKAAYELARLLEKSPANLPEAVEYYKLEADSGNYDAALKLGFIYSGANPPGRNYVEALVWFEKAANQGSIEAQYQLGYRLRWGGEGVQIDAEKAAEWMLLAADAEHIKAQFYAGWMFSNGFGCNQDYEKAASYYISASEGGDAASTCNLGLLYFCGNGLPKSSRKAVSLFKRAIKLGDSHAKYLLAYRYLEGEGVTKDTGEALLLMKEAANEGVVDAMNSLGEWYKSGNVVNLDIEKAIEYYEMASAQNNLNAMNSLGWIYEEGKGGVDLEKAVANYTKAAELGHEYAQCNLAILYEEGKGVPKSLDEAIYWYKLSGRQMHQRALNALRRLGVDPNSPAIRKREIKITPEMQDRVRLALETSMAKEKLSYKD